MPIKSESECISISLKIPNFFCKECDSVGVELIVLSGGGEGMRSGVVSSDGNAKLSCAVGVDGKKLVGRSDR